MTEESSRRQALIVDDVQVNRQLACAMLKRLGWRVSDVDSGAAALQWLACSPRVDLVLLDIGMPDLSGENVCWELRRDRRFAGLVIVAYTAHALQADVARFLANGFDAVLIKPVTLQSMTDVIGRLFPEPT